MKIIYIAGYGRSGSTLLERILGSSDEIIALGEMKDYLFLIEQADEKCACGESINSCPFWKPISDVLKRKDIIKLRKLQKKYESLSGFKYLFFRDNNEDKKIYKKYLLELYSEIHKQSDKDIKSLVDSSKTARDSFMRPFLLKEIDDIEIKVIHLVRDGRACIYSNLTGSNRKLEKGLDSKISLAGIRTAISWALANISPHIFQWRYGMNNYYRLKYEDFIREPENKLKEMEKYLDVDFSKQIEMINRNETIPVSHQIAGNRLRSKVDLRLSSDYQEIWRKKLPIQYKLLFWLFDWPFALAYRYK